MSNLSDQEMLNFDIKNLKSSKTPKKSPNKKLLISEEKDNSTIEKKLPAANNTLNDLNGAEWKFSTKSVINKPYPVNMQHKLRSQHGGQKPPQLCADLIQIFTKKGQKVLDPFGGVGGTLLGASLIGRKATGIELESKWIEIYREVSELEKLEEQEFLLGDSKKVLETIEPNTYDFILTDVPYWNIDKLAKTRNKSAKASKLSTFNEGEDQTKEQWLDEMEIVINSAHTCLKDNKYAAIFIGDMYRDSKYHMLSASLAHVYGYPAAFVPSMIHQNILILKKA